LDTIEILDYEKATAPALIREPLYEY